MVILALAACGAAPDGVPDPNPVALQAGVPWAVPNRAEWPTAAWPVADPQAAGLDPQKLAELDAWLFPPGEPPRGMRTDALVIVRNGRIVHEVYGRDTTVDTPLLTWSVSKSFANTLVGIAVMDGKIDVNAPASTYYPGLDEGIRVTDLLRMSSGLGWDESYETSPIFSPVIQMLYTRGRADSAGFAASFPVVHARGSYWQYSSGTTNILMAIVKNVEGDAYADLPWKRVCEPLGMTTCVFERDDAGTFVGSSYWYASARDVARWAYLYENDGVWEGERILPEGWVRYTTTLAPAFLTTPLRQEMREDNPGAQWYVNTGDPARQLDPPFPDAPRDLFGAIGHWGKRVWVLPSEDIVVVRFGDDRTHLCAAGEEDCEPDPARVYTDAELLTRVLGAITGPTQFEAPADPAVTP